MPNAVWEHSSLVSETTTSYLGRAISPVSGGIETFGDQTPSCRVGGRPAARSFDSSRTSRPRQQGLRPISVPPGSPLRRTSARAAQGIPGGPPGGSYEPPGFEGALCASRCRFAAEDGVEFPSVAQALHPGPPISPPTRGEYSEDQARLEGRPPPLPMGGRPNVPAPPHNRSRSAHGNAARRSTLLRPSP